MFSVLWPYTACSTGPQEGEGGGGKRRSEDADSDGGRGGAVETEKRSREIRHMGTGGAVKDVLPQEDEKGGAQTEVVTSKWIHERGPKAGVRRSFQSALEPALAAGEKAQYDRGGKKRGKKERTSYPEQFRGWPTSIKKWYPSGVGRVTSLEREKKRRKKRKVALI